MDPEEVARLISEARAEGYAQGYAEGLAEGRAEAQEEIRQLREEIDSLRNALRNAIGVIHNETPVPLQLRVPTTCRQQFNDASRFIHF